MKHLFLYILSLSLLFTLGANAQVGERLEDPGFQRENEATVGGFFGYALFETDPSGDTPGDLAYLNYFIQDGVGAPATQGYPPFYQDTSDDVLYYWDDDANTWHATGSTSSVVLNAVAGPGSRVIATHDDGLGTMVNILETVTSMVDNGDGTFTFTNENGASVTAGGRSLVTAVASLTPTSRSIATHNDGQGNVVDIRESLTSIIDNGDGSFSYTAEDGTVTTFTGPASSVVLSGTAAPGSQIIATHNDGLGNAVNIVESVTTLADNGNGTYTYTSENGTTTTINGPASELTIIPTAGPGSQNVAAHDDGLGNVVNIQETVTTLTDNGNGTFTYTSENGAATTAAGATSTMAQVATGGAGTQSIATHTDGLGTAVDILETVTTFVDNGDGTSDFIAEDGTQYLIDERNGMFDANNEGGTWAVLNASTGGLTTLDTDGGALRVSGASNSLLEYNNGAGVRSGIYTNAAEAQLFGTNGVNVSDIMANANGEIIIDSSVAVYDFPTAPPADGNGNGELIGRDPLTGHLELIPAFTETTTTLVDNTDGSYTYTSEDATATVIDTDADSNPAIDTQDLIGGGAGATTDVQALLDAIALCLSEWGETSAPVNNGATSVTIVPPAGFTAADFFDAKLLNNGGIEMSLTDYSVVGANIVQNLSGAENVANGHTVIATFRRAK